MELLIAIFIDGKDVREVRLRAETEVDVIAEDEAMPADRNDVARGAVVFSGDPLGGDQARGDGTENLLPGVIEFLESCAEIRALGGEASAEDLVSALIEGR